METLGIVLGLGNPGPRYQWTRHNLGFRVVEELARRAGTGWIADPGVGGLAWTAQAEIDEGRYVLAMPRTFMNRSGQAGAALCRQLDVPVERMLVVYDDADLALGRIRLRRDGGPGGHNGVRSLIDALGTPGFPRIRLGVRGEMRGERDLADYVLDEFGPEEGPIAADLVALGADAAESVWVRGVTRTMDRFNGRSVVAAQEDREQQ